MFNLISYHKKRIYYALHCNFGLSPKQLLDLPIRQEVDHSYPAQFMFHEIDSFQDILQIITFKLGKMDQEAKSYKCWNHKKPSATDPLKVYHLFLMVKLQWLLLILFFTVCFLYDQPILFIIPSSIYPAGSINNNNWYSDYCLVQSKANILRQLWMIKHRPHWKVNNWKTGNWFQHTNNKNSLYSKYSQKAAGNIGKKLGQFWQLLCNLGFANVMSAN